MEIFREIFFTAPRARYGVFSSTLKGKMNSNECTKTFTHISETCNVAGSSEKGRQVGESALDQDYKSQEPTNQPCVLGYPVSPQGPQLPHLSTGSSVVCSLTHSPGSPVAHVNSTISNLENYNTFNNLINFPGGSDGKASAYNARDLGSIPGSGRSSGQGNGNSLQYSCLENPMDRGAW